MYARAPCATHDGSTIITRVRGVIGRGGDGGESSWSVASALIPISAPRSYGRVERWRQAVELCPWGIGRSVNAEVATADSSRNAAVTTATMPGRSRTTGNASLVARRWGRRRWRSSTRVQGCHHRCSASCTELNVLDALSSRRFHRRAKSCKYLSNRSVSSLNWRYRWRKAEVALGSLGVAPGCSSSLELLWVLGLLLAAVVTDVLMTRSSQTDRCLRRDSKMM